MFTYNFFSAAGGEIFNLCLPDLEETIEETAIIRLIRQILEGVFHLHQNNIVHLDLKVICIVTFIDSFFKNCKVITVKTGFIEKEVNKFYSTSL